MSNDIRKTLQILNEAEQLDLFAPPSTPSPRGQIVGMVMYRGEPHLKVRGVRQPLGVGDYIEHRETGYAAEIVKIAKNGNKVLMDLGHKKAWSDVSEWYYPYLNEAEQMDLFGTSSKDMLTYTTDVVSAFPTRAAELKPIKSSHIRNYVYFQFENRHPDFAAAARGPLMKDLWSKEEYAAQINELVEEYDPLVESLADDLAREFNLVVKPRKIRDDEEVTVHHARKWVFGHEGSRKVVASLKAVVYKSVNSVRYVVSLHVREG